MERVLPGTIPFKGREFIYIEASDRESFLALFHSIASYGDGGPPSDGGALTESAAIFLPDGTQLYGLSYKGDIEGWRKCVEACARALARLLGTIDDDAICLSNGDRIPLAACRIDLY